MGEIKVFYVGEFESKISMPASVLVRKRKRSAHSGYTLPPPSRTDIDQPLMRSDRDQRALSHVHCRTLPSEIPIPKPDRPVRFRPNVLRHTKQPHHEIIHFHVLEPVHNVDVVRGRVPALVLVGHPGLVVEGFHDVRERAVSDEHCVHAEIPVVVSVVLEGVL